MTSVGIKALAVTYPKRMVSSEALRRRHPELIKSAGDKALAKVWSLKEAGEAAGDPWAIELAPYLDDPFRGTKERRWLGEGETGLSLEVDAAKKALAAAKMAPSDIECAVVTSFRPDQHAVGNAAYFARAMQLGGHAFNMESACSSSFVGLQTAVGLIASGQYRTVMVVGSCTYSRDLAETDSLAWAVGDGAYAFILGEVPAGEGFLGFHGVHTAATCDSMFHETVLEADGTIAMRMRAGKTSSTAMRAAAEMALQVCVPEAAKRAGVSLKEIAFFATTTPVAWYSAFAQRVLGFGPEKTFNGHPLYANNGPALMPGNLFHGAHEGRFKKGDLVLLQTVGSVSSAGAAVLRWGDVALGEFPAAPTEGE